MKKVNFLLDDEVDAELRRLAPPRKRSALVNEALQKELLQRKRQEAFKHLKELCQKTATLSSKQALEFLRRDRRSH